MRGTHKNAPSPAPLLSRPRREKPNLDGRKPRPELPDIWNSPNTCSPSGLSGRRTPSRPPITQDLTHFSGNFRSRLDPLRRLFGSDQTAWRHRLGAPDLAPWRGSPRLSAIRRAADFSAGALELEALPGLTFLAGGTVRWHK